MSLAGVASSILDAIPHERVLHSNSLGAVTLHCVVVVTGDGRAQAAIALSQLVRIRKRPVSHPVFLVVSVATLVLALAAFVSSQGEGAGVPFTLAGFLLLFCYFFGSSQCRLVLMTDSETIETAVGTSAEAKSLTQAVADALQMYNPRRAG